MRFHSVICSTLLAVCLLPMPSDCAGQSAKDLEAKLLALNSADWRTAFSVGSDVADANAAASFAAIKAAWPKVTNVAARQQLIKAFYYAMPFPLHPRNHPSILAILNLGATDSEAQVQQFAFEYLKEICLQDFSRDPAGYALWYAANSNQPVEDISRSARIELIKTIAKSSAADREKLADRLERLGFARNVDFKDPEIAITVRSVGILKLIEGWLSSPAVTEKTVRLAGILFDGLKPEDGYMERTLRPLLEGEKSSSKVKTEVVRIVSQRAFPWAVDPLLAAIKRSILFADGAERFDVAGAAAAVGKIGGPRVIPDLIAAIQYDDTYNTIYGIGSFGLTGLTGVRYSARHDGAWWGKWWEKNKTKFPSSVRKMRIPDLRPPDDPAATSAAAADKRVAWLKANAVHIRSIDPNDDDFADLMPLVKAIGDARVVQLGEQSHGDGATFTAKCRLVRFLHERMGFDVLAWESGLFDCDQMEKALHSNAHIQEAIDGGIFPIWGTSGFVTPVFKYARETHSTPRPLIMAGFDCQFSSMETGEKFNQFLNDFLRKSGTPLIDDTQRKSIEAVTPELRGDYKPTAAKRTEFRSAVNKLIAAIREKESAVNQTVGAKESAYVLKVLNNLLVYEELRTMTFSKAEDNNIRDKSMSENLLWLMHERYKDKKIIVWAATMHISHNLPKVKSTVIDYAKLVNMGQGVHEALKEKVYTIGFTAYEGSAGNAFSTGQALHRASTGSLESLWHFAGVPLSFVDFRSLPGDSWLRKQLSSRPLGYAPMDAVWPDVIDGMFYTDTMFAAGGNGLLPGRYRTASPKPSELDKEVRTVLEQIRRFAWDWELTFNQVLAPEPAGCDPKRITNEMDGEWPELLGFDSDRLTDSQMFRRLPADGSGYKPDELGVRLVGGSLMATLAPKNNQALLLMGGIGRAGLIDSGANTTVYSSGDVAGDIRLKSYSTAIVKGNVLGALSTNSYFNGVITGDLSGKFEASSAGNLYILGRLTGTANLSAGDRKFWNFKLWIGGRTTRKDLERIQGPGTVWLVDSDLPPGVHKFGSLTVTVAPTKR